MVVSVLLTSFDHERYVAQAIESVLAQEGVELELLIGDDASNDGTRAVIERYAAAHPDTIRTFLPERNLGNAGKAIFAELIPRARGDHLAMLDADDYWTAPDKLVRQVAHLDAHPECSMCFHDVLMVFEEDGRPDERHNGPDRPAVLTASELMGRCVVASCTPLFRRETIASLPDWYFELPWGDWPLYFMAAERGELHYLPEVMGVYRIHSGGMYRGLARIEALEQRSAFYKGLRVPAEHDRERRRKLAGTYVKRALEHNRLGQRAAALSCLLRAPWARLGRGRAGTSPSARG